MKASSSKMLSITLITSVNWRGMHAAIGSDLDGGFGREQSPSDLDTIADLQKLVEILTLRGYSLEDVLLVMHGNWLRLLRNAWVS